MRAQNVALFVGASMIVASAAGAHTLRVACHNVKDSVSCTGDYSDGERAAGAAVRVVTEQDKVITSGKADARGTYTFKKPATPYHVVIQTGPHHVTNLSSIDVK